MKNEVYIENLKCGGCANTITKGLKSLEEIEDIVVDVEKSLITFTYNGSDEVLKKVKTKLSDLGYPEVGDKNTIVHKAKSFVSCATGKITK